MSSRSNGWALRDSMPQKITGYHYVLTGPDGTRSITEKEYLALIEKHGLSLADSSTRNSALRDRKEV